MNYGKRSTTEHWKTVWGAAHSPWLSFFRISKLINYFENSDSFGLKQREKEKREISAHSFELCWPHYLELLPDGNGSCCSWWSLARFFKNGFTLVWGSIRTLTSINWLATTRLSYLHKSFSWMSRRKWPLMDFAFQLKISVASELIKTIAQILFIGHRLAKNKVQKGFYLSFAYNCKFAIGQQLRIADHLSRS